MPISAKIVADSVSPAGKRLTTLQLRYPKMVHGEFLTHRAFSRNSSSSRAIPVERMIQDVIDDPALPVWWGAAQKGMQAATELDDLHKGWAVERWLEARDAAVREARGLLKLGLHKQLVNRVIEPFCHINTLVTATEFDNFFELRCHPDAQPEIRVLAEMMRDAMAESTPTVLQPGQWHLPYADASEWTRSFASDVDWSLARKVSVARCARVSYLTQDGQPTSIKDDLALYDRLVASRPLHASPCEHQAMPDEDYLDERFPSYPDGSWNANRWRYPEEHGNFVGWRQYRRQLEAAL